ncbi:hypothetical protein HID58_012852 [Brassica napus]|uniref:MYB-CC type transcription factor LHEQLE-containing domain-containing protein n=1 Tax=Brassica napus TaxID=3708 RepID=A0ABQ8E296_BRANA|nr:hypothetical protein HID58_012852 [Brassica napus]
MIVCYGRNTMEARPVQRSCSMEIINLARTTLIPSNPSTGEESFIRSENNNTHLMSRPSVQQTYHLLSSSNNGAVGHICSSTSSGFSTNLHYSSTVSHEKHGSSSNDTSWCHDSLHGGRFLDLPEASHVDDGGIGSAFDDIQKRNDWHEWADHLITDEDPLLSTNWSDLLLDTSSHSDSKVQIPPQAHQTVQQQPSPSVELRPVSTTSSNSNSGTGKTRMRWTPELHEAFVEAVNSLGGSERATPKGRLDIDHNHQKMVDTLEKKLTPLEHIASLDLKGGIGITEALRLQMEVQNVSLDENVCLFLFLQLQRNLQLRIEEQGKYLQMMFEKQNSGLEKRQLQNQIPQSNPTKKTRKQMIKRSSYQRKQGIAKSLNLLRQSVPKPDN